MSPEQKVGGGDGASVLKQEQHTEYRDQHGNLLNEEQVAALAGQVSFSTHYETRTRLVDAAGNVIAEGADVDVGGAGVAPPHPDVEGRNPETAGKGIEGGVAGEGSKVDNQPATADAQKDLEKEKNVEKEEKERRGLPKPGSEGNQATGK